MLAAPRPRDVVTVTRITGSRRSTFVTRPDGTRTREKADPQIGRFPLGAIADAESPSPPRGGSGERVPTGEEAGFSLGVPMVRIHLPPAASPLRTRLA
jgi:hypothetical protein